jgi:uncharacterized protein
MIRESIITTTSVSGEVHIAPMGVIWQDEVPVLAPFRPSRTLENLLARRTAVINHTDDVRVFAGCLTGRRDWPVHPADKIDGAAFDDDAVRPRFRCRVVHAATHAGFRGFNRAQAAVIEGAILVSRLELLPFDKIEREMAYLEIAVSKTAGPQEREAWEWLAARVDAFRREQAEKVERR